MPYVAIVTVLLLLQVAWFAFGVGQMRIKHGVKAPAMDGPDEFLRAFRVHANTNEQLIVLLPAMWLFALYLHAEGAAILGLVFLVSRFLYRSAYLRDPSTRGKGFGLGFLAIVISLAGGLVGAIMALVQAIA